MGTDIAQMVVTTRSRSAGKANKMASTPLLPFDKSCEEQTYAMCIQLLRGHLVDEVQSNPSEFMGIVHWERKPDARLVRAIPLILEKPPSQTGPHMHAKKKNASAISSRRVWVRCITENKRDSLVRCTAMRSLF